MTSLAIVGMGCRFPGGVTGVRSYWDLLCQGRCGIDEIPASRWSLDGFYDPTPDVPGRSYSKWGGFLDDVTAFDPEFFGLNAREAEAMDPQQRLLLTVAYEAVQDARMPLSMLRQRSTGVFVGLSNTDYDHLQRMCAGASDIQAGTGTALSIVANRLSNNLDLSGPSLGVDTACSSSLVALDTACRHLRDGTCDIAIVAGVNIMLDPRLFATFSQAHMLSPTGQIRAFDCAANGFVRGEGVGVAILKRDDEARSDRDRIYARIKATAINQDGATGTITAPNPDAQRRMMQSVATAAGIAKDAVSYAEAHGTGTVVGDPIEANAIGDVFGGRDRAAALYVGSSKPNLGHLEPAAGIAGLIKAALVLHHRKIPPSLGFERPNPKIRFDEHRLVVNDHLIDLPPSDLPAHALVNSFGFGGTNACALLSEASEPARPASVPDRSTACSGRPRGAVGIPLSAPTEAHLHAFADRLRSDVSDGGPLAGLTLGQIGAALAVQRDHFDYRAMIVASSRHDLIDKLACLAEDRTWPKTDPRDPPGIVRGRARPDRKLVFTMTGQGGQWWSMGRALLERHPVFRETVLDFDAVFKQTAGWSVVDVLTSDEAHSTIDDAAVTPAVMFAFQTGLAAVWQAAGVRPDIVVGHSFGEVTAAYLAGGLSRETVANLVNQRGLIRGQVDRHGSMAAVGLSANDVAAYLPDDGSVEIGGYNAPHMVTLTGDEAAIDALIAEVQADDPTKLARKLALDFAYHSSWFEPVEQRFMADVGNLETSPPTIPVVSTVTGELNTSFGAHYWWRNLRFPVRYQAAIETALGMGGDTFIELGPHRTLSSMTAGCAANQGRDVVTISTLYRQWDDFESLATALGDVYVNGFDIDWHGVFGAHAWNTVDLPCQPLINKQLWIEPRETAQTLRPTFWHPLLGTLDLSPAAQWSNTLTLAQHPYLRDHTISGRTVFPAAAYIEMMATAARHVFGSHSIELHHVEFIEALEIGAGDEIDLRTIFDQQRSRLDIYTRLRSDDGDWRLNARCAARARDFSLPPADAMPPSAPIDADDFYAAAQQAGFEYGPAFKCLTEIRIGTDDAVGRARQSSAAHIDAEKWWLDPCLLDSCLQLMIPLRDEPGLCLPVSIDRILASNTLGPDVTARLTRSRDLDTLAETYRLDIHAHGEDGGLILEGIRTRQLGRRAENMGRERFAIEADAAAGVIPTPTAIARPTSVLVLGDGRSVESQHLVQAFRDSGAVACLDDIAAGATPTAERLQHLIEQWHPRESVGLIVYAPDVSEQRANELEDMVARISRHTQHLIAFGQAVTALAGHLADVPIVVTSRQSPDIEHATLSAVARTIASECPTLDVRMAITDGSPASSISLALWATGSSRETEVMLHQGDVRVPRLKERSPQTWRPRHCSTAALATDTTFALIREDRNGRKPLGWRAQPKPPRDSDQVTVRVAAVGLNFRDVMVVNGMLPAEAEFGDAGQALGLEFAGIITQAPPGETALAAGQQVFGLARGALRGEITVDARCVFALPDHLTVNQAATLPSAYLTAYYALASLSRLEAGQWVLIHSGAGGLGLAAVQVAKARGARIIATAGNAAKRAYLRDLGVDVVVPSRTLDFVGTVAAVTNGRGVDVVLNALPGEFVSAGLDCLAAYGHFIELGKRDIYADRAIGLKAMRRNNSLHVVDVAALIQDRPDLVRRLMTDILEKVANGDFPALPVTSYSASQVDEAFRYFASGEHVGKISLDLTDSRLQVELDPSSAVTRTGTILITGGSSDVAHSMARACAERGCRKVVLASRRAAAGARFKSLQQDGRALGCDIQAVALDVTDAAATGALIENLARPELPLKGIIHAAVAYDDALLADMTTDKINAVLAPKIKGATNLSRAVLASGCTLDFFVSFSSMAQVVGWPGQSNYAAANAFLEAFVTWQRDNGIPAYCINWGVFAQSGQVARDARLASYMTRAGWTGLQDSTIAKRLFEVIASDEPVISIYDADWQEITRNNKSLATSARVVELRDAKRGGSGASGAATLGELDGDALRQQAKQLVLGSIADVVRSDVESLSHCVQLNDAGIDSLSMFELRLQLERKSGLVVPLPRFVEAATIVDLTKLVCELAGSDAT